MDLIWARALERVRIVRSVVRLRPYNTDSPAGRSLERYRRIALTSLSGLGVRMIGTLTGLVTVPLVLAYLGKERYGLWTALTTVVAWMSLFDFGVANGLVNAVARAHGRDDDEGADRYVATAFWSLVVVAAMLLIALTLTAPLVPWDTVFAAKKVSEPDTLKWCAVAAIGTFIIAMPLSVVPQIFAGYQRTYVANAFTLVGTLGGFAALVASVRWRVGMPVLVIVLGAGPLLATSIGLLYARFRAMPWLRFRVESVTRTALRGLMARSLPIFLFQVGALMVNQTQTIMLAHRCDLRAVADYGIVMRLYFLIVSLIQLSTASFVPTFREARERGDAAWMRRGFSRFVSLRVGMSTVGAIGLIFGGNAALRFWLRTEGVRFDRSLWVALGIMMVAAVWVSAHAELLSIMDKLWVQVALVLINGTVSLSLTYWLAPVHRLMGVVLGTAAVTVLVYSWLLPLLARRILSEPNVAVRPAEGGCA